MTPPGSRSFPRRSRLRHALDFQRVQRTGRRRSGRHFVAVVAPRRGDSPALGLAVSRKVGDAVRRNHVKRRIREWFRTASAEGAIPANSDLVVIARRGAAQLDAADIGRELSELLAC